MRTRSIVGLKSYLTAPATQAHDITFTNITGVTFTINWTVGSGAKRLVILRQGSAPNATPSANTTYAASTVFGSGDALGGGYVVYNGDDNNVSVSGLSVTTTYYAQVFEYDGAAGAERYNTSTATNNPNSGSTNSTNPPPSYALLRFSVKYRTTDFAYQTTTVYSDALTMQSGANLVRVATASDTDAQYVTGASYMYADDPDNDRILFYHAAISGLATVKVWKNDFTSDYVISPSAGSAFAQGICVDPVNQHIYSFTPSSPSQVIKFNLSGTALTTLTPPTFTRGVHWYYDYYNGRFFASEQGVDGFVYIWTPSGSNINLTETKWYKAFGGVCYDYVFDRVVVQDSPASQQRHRENTLDGLSDIHIYTRPFPGNMTPEGIAVLPDGTTLVGDPMGHDGPVVGGNRLWQFDPRGVYRKFDRSPSMTRFTRWTGGTVTGQFDTQRLTQTEGQKLYSPVYDTNGFSNTENASAYEFEFESAGDADITFRGSNSAPTGSSKTMYYSDLPTYAGWGATTPSAEQSTPGTFRYKQAVLTVKAATASSTITPAYLVAQLAPQILIIEHNGTYLHYLSDPTGGPTNQIKIDVNQATPSNYFSNATTSTRWVFQSAGYSDDQSTSAVMTLGTPSLITGDQTGQLTVVRRRESSSTLDMILAVGTSGSANNRIMIKHTASSGGSSPTNSIVLEETNSSGTVINRVYFADTDVKYCRYDVMSSGSAWSMNKNGVSQTLSSNAGSNTGNWFGDLSSPNVVQRGSSTGNAGRGRYKFFFYRTTVLSGAENTLLDNYFAQEGMIDP